MTLVKLGPCVSTAHSHLDPVTFRKAEHLGHFVNASSGVPREIPEFGEMGFWSDKRRIIARHIVTKEGIGVDLDKVEAILGALAPTNAKP